METINNILYPTDFTKTSNNALPYLIDLVKKSNGKLNLLHVYDVPILAPAKSFSSISVLDPITDVANKIRLAALNKLKQIIKKNKLEDAPHRCFLREGNIKDNILNEAKKNSVDIIVIGTKGEAAEKGFFMSSITKGIIQDSICPVLAIPESAKFSTISKIVYATDLQFDETSMLNYIVNFAKLYNASISVLHIDEDIEIKKWSIDLLKDIIKKTNYSKISFKEKIVNDTIEGINKYIQEQKADVIAMTTYNTSMLNNIFQDSLTKQMLFKTKIPILTFSRRKYSTLFTN